MFNIFLSLLLIGFLGLYFVWYRLNIRNAAVATTASMSPPQLRAYWQGLQNNTRDSAQQRGSTKAARIIANMAQAAARAARAGHSHVELLGAFPVHGYKAAGLFDINYEVNRTAMNLLAAYCKENNLDYSIQHYEGGRERVERDIFVLKW